MLSATAETGNMDLTFFFFLTEEDGSSDTDENFDEITITKGNDFIQKKETGELGRITNQSQNETEKLFTSGT